MIDVTALPVSFTHDGNGNRLTMSDGQPSQEMRTYADVGNRLTEKRGAATTTSTHNNADQMTQRGSTAYAYDANGQQTAAGSRAFVWNVAGQLASSTQSGGNAARSRLTIMI